MSPKTLTGAELDLNDAPARDAELFLVDGNNLAYRAFFALPEADKQRYCIKGQAGARGYTPFGREIAVGAAAHDLQAEAVLHDLDLPIQMMSGK